ncbi:hypothetical protein ETU08_11260 [Apibacter muscae]|uniref:hypothetical protein n=1 Tax=Apibacter muscae TaxID=2509004 RepID=UPI0011ABDBF9|nr:hypothetical protein [Apibacter muscae]TWP27576.1 hypothetical protein ETU08_11260 [Apibacter muscae]
MEVKDWKHTRLYKVSHTVEVKERSTLLKSETAYDLGIHCSTHPELKRRIFSKENLHLNGAWPKDPTVRLYAQLELATYPLEIEVDEEENFLTLPTYRLWLTHWKKKADALLSEQYHGDFAESLKENFLVTMDTEEKLKQKLQQEAFWNLFFFNCNEEDTHRLRWNFLKLGNAAFSGSSKEESAKETYGFRFQGQLEEINEDFTKTLNEKLKFPWLSKNYIHAADLQGECTILSLREKENGRLEHKSAEIILKSKNNQYFYNEKIEIKHQGISLRKIEPSHAFTFFLSEKEEETN